MRNPNRIPRVLSVVARFWNDNPDLRLGQILVAAAKGNPFHMEDDKLIEILEKAMREQMGL